MDFESSLKNENAAIAIDFHSSNKVLLIAFGGFADRLGIPMFEFNKVTRGFIDINKIYLRDKYRFWYHKGLPGISNNLRGTVEFLKKYTTHPSTHRTITIGTSGGGYAALLFGCLLNCNEIHAFSPKTFISPLKRIIYKDHSSHVPAGKLLELALVGNRKYFDVKEILSKSPPSKSNYHIYYSDGNRLDKLHAERIKDIHGIHLHAFPYENHNLVKLLRDNGTLSAIIDNAIRIE